MEPESNNSTANTTVTRWENDDESSVHPGLIHYIKSPITPPETEAEKL